MPVALFSLEMASVQLTRLISSETGLSSEKLRTGKLEKHEWNN
jgi:replicative DNA helicase